MPSLWGKIAAYRRALGLMAAFILWCSVLTLLLAALLPWLAGMPWSEATGAWLSVVENLRLLIGLTAGVVAVAGLVLRRGRLVAASCFAIALSCVPVLANIGGVPPVTEGTPELKVMTFNLWVLNHETDRIIAYLREQKPDVVFLEEVTESHKQAFAVLADLYPTQVTCHGNIVGCETMLLSRFPARRQAAGPIKGALPSTAVAELDVGGRVLTAVAVHVV